MVYHGHGQYELGDVMACIECDRIPFWSDFDMSRVYNIYHLWYVIDSHQNRGISWKKHVIYADEYYMNNIMFRCVWKCATAQNCNFDREHEDKQIICGSLFSEKADDYKWL